MLQFVYILRHGEAVDVGTAHVLDDAQRYLTGKGEKQSAMAGRVLRQAGVMPDAVWTSPLVRARQTAEVFAGAFDTPPVMVVEEALAIPGDLEGVLARLETAEAEHLVLVGHEDFLGQLLYRLICGAGGGAVPLSKGSLACVRLEPGMPGIGSLRWLVHPKLSKALL